MCKLSIIVPIYNVEQFLPRCIESILSQTFHDFELILVEDGSPDRCGVIIDEYAKLDDRIITIHQTNNGVSAARNAGLNIARGEYIGFVDPDDWAEASMYDLLIEGIIEERCDIASCTWYYNDENGNVLRNQPLLPTKVMSGNEYMAHLFDMPPTIYGSVCSKIFRTDIIKTGFSSNYIICEDNLFVAECCSRAKKALYINEALYHVYTRSDSATRKEKGRIALGLPARREIIGVAHIISRECGLLAERSFIDQCVTIINLKDIDPTYNKMAVDEFLSYMHENPFCIFNNDRISVKQKVYFMYYYLSLKMRGGNLKQL